MAPRPSRAELRPDTPTALLEAAGPQWFWLEELHPGLDQWNSLHERLVDAWRKAAPNLSTDTVHFTYTAGDETGEDFITATYLQECAEQAGLATVCLPVEQIALADRPPLWIEPAWKMLLSNKALLALLWERCPGPSQPTSVLSGRTA
jgi:glutathionylspermidine synthase